MRRIALTIAALSALALLGAKAVAADVDESPTLPIHNLVYRTYVDSDAIDGAKYQEVHWWGYYRPYGYYSYYAPYSSYYYGYAPYSTYYAPYSTYYAPGYTYPYSTYYPGYSTYYPNYPYYAQRPWRVW